MFIKRLTTGLAALGIAGSIAGGIAGGLAAGAASAQDFVRLSTLGPGSSPYLVMSTFAQIVNEELDGDVQVQVNATGAATRHAVDAAREEIELFMSSPTVHNFMASGTAMYAQVADAPALSENLRNILSFPIGSYHIVTYADSGIESLEDLEGRRVFLGPPGGGALNTMRTFVELATGLDTETDMEVVQLGWDAASQAFMDGQLEAYANPTNAPSPVIQQMAFGRPIRLIGVTADQLDNEGMDGFVNRPGGTLDTIAPDMYGENQVNDEPVTTIGSTVGIGTHANVPEELVYAMTRAFWEGLEARMEGSPWLSRVQLDHALAEMNIPLHPGAARYYREVGIDIPEALEPPQ